MIMDYNNLEYRRFTSRSEADKALNSLNGLLTGIAIDNVVEDQELKELDVWCQTHKDLVNRNPFREFMITIQNAIIAPANRLELIEDLKWLIQKYENDSFYYTAVTYEVQVLQGICHGILADGKVSDDEIMELNTWLNDHEVLATYYPYDELKSMVLSILSDGKIEEEESIRLTALMNEFVSIEDSEVAKFVEERIEGVDIDGICTSDPDIVFKDKTFCFTGISEVKPNKEEIYEIIEDLGGQRHDSLPSRKTDYLIVAANKNPCWAFACYGRKVEKAIKERKKGSTISIIHEYDFWDFAADAGYDLSGPNS